MLELSPKKGISTSMRRQIDGCNSTSPEVQSSDDEGGYAGASSEAKLSKLKVWAHQENRVGLKRAKWFKCLTVSGQI